MKTDIDSLKDLTPDQLRTLRSLVESVGYRKAAEHASEEFARPIPKHALQRFIRRSAPAEFLEDAPEKDEATRQILKFAADGQPNFTASTLDALEKLAFQLALTCTAIDDDMNALTKITAMLCRFRNTACRERMAVVQEGKLKLREKQFGRSSIHPDHDAQINDLNQKIADAFDSHPVLTAIEKGSPGVSPVPAAVSPADDSANHPILRPNPDLLPNPLSAARDPESPGVPPKNKNCETQQTQSSTLDEKPGVGDTSVVIEEQTRNHTARRWLSYTPRRPCDPEPDNSWINECPCGQKLPCATHADLWRELRYTKPYDPDYAAALARAGIHFLPPALPDQSRETPNFNAKCSMNSHLVPCAISHDQSTPALSPSVPANHEQQTTATHAIPNP